MKRTLKCPRAGVRLLSLLLMCSATCMGAGPVPARGMSPDPSESVFLLLTVPRSPQDQYTGVAHGAAFFIASNGEALTNASVVYGALTDPAHNWLLAVVSGEIYQATIVCATPPPYNPADPHPFGVRWSRDLAEIALSALPLEAEVLRVALPGGPTLTLPPAHRGPLPPFPPLAEGPDPKRGDPVRVLWVDPLQPRPAVSEAIGRVENTSATSPLFLGVDFTPIFSVALASQAVPGNSGAPVLDSDDRVVGIWTWYSLHSASRGVAISSAAFTQACP